MRETVYEHLEGKETFTITAAERVSVNMVRRLKAAHPGEVEIVSENEDGSILARMPYSWMRIVPKRRVELTAEQKAAAGERLRKLREDKAGNG